MMMMMMMIIIIIIIMRGKCSHFTVLSKKDRKKATTLHLSSPYS